jgi:tetratricopeptide (TPR) repeat protein
MKYLSYATKYLPVILLVIFCAAPAAAQIKQKEKQAKTLFQHHKDKKALKIYKQILKKDSDNLSALWHASLLYSRLGSEHKHKGKQKKYFKNAGKYADKALKANDSSSEANYAKAIAVGEEARTKKNINQKLKDAKDIRKYGERAVQEDSTNANAWFLLGTWNYKIASKGNLASSMPGLKGASMKKAKQDIQKALKIDPSNSQYLHGLARVYQAKGENDKAVKTCKKAIQKAGKGKNKGDIKKKCQKLIHSVKNGS